MSHSFIQRILEKWQWLSPLATCKYWKSSLCSPRSQEFYINMHDIKLCDWHIHIIFSKLRYRRDFSRSISSMIPPLCFIIYCEYGKKVHLSIVWIWWILLLNRWWGSRSQLCSKQIRWRTSDISWEERREVRLKLHYCHCLWCIDTLHIIAVLTDLLGSMYACMSCFYFGKFFSSIWF